MNPLIILLGGGAALFLLAKSGKKTAEPTGPKVQITGPSGVKWFIEHYTDMRAGYIYTKVTMPGAQFGMQGDVQIFTYTTPIGASSPNQLVTLNPEAARTLIDRAVSDFNVTVPAGLELPED